MRITRELRVVLTPEERIERAIEHRQKNDELNVLKADFAADTKSRKQTMRKLMDSAANGYEHREVSCDERRDLDAGRVTVVRLDTGEVIEQRLLTDEERQLELADVGNRAHRN